jgi:hypothetical protein
MCCIHDTIFMVDSKIMGVVCMHFLFLKRFKNYGISYEFLLHARKFWMMFSLLMHARKNFR